MNQRDTTENDALSRADRDALYDRLAAMLCYEKHHQREGEFCPNCRSRAGTVHGPIVLGVVRRIAAERNRQYAASQDLAGMLAAIRALAEQSFWQTEARVLARDVLDVLNSVTSPGAQS